MQYARVDGQQGVVSRKAEREHREMSLKSRIDSETAGRWIHRGHVLRVMDLLQRQLGPVVPVTVVQMLANQRMRLDCEETVYLQDYYWSIY